MILLRLNTSSLDTRSSFNPQDEHVVEICAIAAHTHTYELSAILPTPVVTV
jgi:hypothetical protein